MPSHTWYGRDTMSSMRSQEQCPSQCQTRLKLCEDGKNIIENEKAFVREK